MITLPRTKHSQSHKAVIKHTLAHQEEEEEEDSEEEEDLFVFNDTIEGPRAPAVKSGRIRDPPFTHYPFPARSLVCGGQPSPHKPRLVVSHSTCPPLSSFPHAHSFVIGPAVINTHTRENSTHRHVWRTRAREAREFCTVRAR